MRTPRAGQHLFLCGCLAAALALAAGRACAQTSAPAAPPPPAVLRWNNGETLAGDLLSADAGTLAWRSPLFDAPLGLAWHALRRLDRPLPDREPEGAFAFTLRDGSHLYGDLLAVTAEAVTVRRAGEGEAVLRRGEVLSARRLRGGRLVYAGPHGAAGWEPAQSLRAAQENTTPSEAAGRVPTRLTGPGGALEMPYWRRTFFLPLALPPAMEVEFRVRGVARPDFQLSLEDDRHGRLRIETWGDELVLAAGDGFLSLRRLGEQEREVALRVDWDPASRHCQVYTPEGQLLQAWTAPPEKRDGPPGVRLQNRGRQLALDFLRVRSQDAQAPPPPPAADAAGQARVELLDGRVLAGTVGAVADGAVTLVPPDGGAAAGVGLDAVEALVFSDAAPWRHLPETTLTCADGTFLRGTLAGVADGVGALRTTFTDAPLRVATGALQQMTIRAPAPAGAAPEPALKTLDRLTAGDATLHGRLTASGGAAPGWLAVGAERPVGLAPSVPCEIVRAPDLAPVAPEMPAAAPVALLHTRGGDALPGVLHGLDRQTVEFDSPLAEARTLPAADVLAVQFGVRAGGAVQGFRAPGWQVLRGVAADVLASGDRLRLTDGAAAGHPAAAGVGEVRFTYDTQNFSCLRVRLFCDGTDPARGLSYLLFQQSGTMMVGLEAAEGQFSGQNRIATRNGPAAVRLVIDDKGVRCYVNDALAETVPCPAAKRAGSGLLLEPVGIWGNQVREVSLSGFSATLEPGQAALPAAHADAKAQALTVPRFRKDDPPRHALLAANGDLLRGEVEALTNTQFGFRVGLESLKVPRERVRAVVMLQAPSADAPATPPAEEDAAAKALDRASERQGRYSRAGLSTYLSVLRQMAPELTFKAPPEPDQRRLPFNFAGQTVRTTLDALCDLFGLRYHLEGTTVVLERGRADAPAGDLVRRVYWLKADAPFGGTPARDALAARGVAFPAGASAVWRPDARQLEVLNTPASQAALADGLGRGEFGGGLGSPTHWLRLADGGHLALAVEAFGPDAVRGTHPLYGHCAVPLAEVYAVRNTPPGPGEAGRAVEGWRLVAAPEPVLPESGGEGGALLGKDAPGFKLGLLAGGDFELAGARGQVVVLDFWATWCGPCVKALPELIEAMAQFPPERVRLVGLDQAEPPAQVKRFLETRGWQMAVALDAGQNVARQYGVDGIPHTVIVGPDGKVAWVRTGYSPDEAGQAAEAVKKLLAPAAGK